MKTSLFSFTGLLLAGSLLGQKSNNNAEPSTLNELSVQGTSIPELDLSRSSILTRDQIQDRQIDNLVDLSGLTPNLHINANAIQSYGDIISIRGIANTQLFGAPGVQLYVDGVPQADVSSYSSTLYDIESVEILRGPQGYQYGKSVTGGAINIKTKTPGKKQSNKISASYGTFDSQKYNISSKGPLSDGFSYSMAVRRALSEGYLNNSSGADNTSETWHGALKLYLDKGNGTKVSFGANFETHELGAQPIVKRNQSDFYSRSTDFDGIGEEYTEIDRNQQFLTIESELDGTRLISVTNRNDWSLSPNRLDLDISTVISMLSPQQTSVILQDQTELSQEVRLESEEQAELDWVLGAFYADSEIKGDATRSFGLIERTQYTLESKSIALFSLVGKNLSEDDYLSLGLRYDKFDKQMKRDKTNSMFGSSPQVNGSNDFSSFSPSIKWEHSFSDELTGNARVTYAEKPGGFSAYADNAAESVFMEEETLAYEVSILFSPSDSWGVNLTAYLNDIKNYQFELPDPNPSSPMDTDYFVANADEVTAKGIEIEGFLKPAESVTLSVAYGLSDSEYDKFTGSGLVGKQVSFVPKQTLALSAIYQLENGVYGQIGTKTIGDTHFWDYNGLNTADKIDSYTLLDANIGYDFNSWELKVFGHNLTDEEYYTSLVNYLPGTPGIAGSPRVIGLSVSKEF